MTHPAQSTAGDPLTGEPSASITKIGAARCGVVLMAVEHAPAHRRGSYAALPQVGAAAGLLVANGVFSIVQLSISAADSARWGWRSPFLRASPLAAVFFASETGKRQLDPS